ncbi:MAG: hypothetical protein QG597_1153, partial [Actinomycetota bacterium]|nr:hypothetical protein [Actinomycetota bacterium]
MSIIEIENVTKTFQGHGGSTTA